MLNPIKLICAVILLCKTVIAARGYYGAHLGPLSQLDHGVSGDVYAVDSRTLFIKNFNYDGEGPAAYFIVGNTKRPGNQGSIRLRDERGSSGVIRRYRNKDITLSLPEGKTLRDIKWFSVYCEEYSVNFGDVTIPRNFDFPRPFKLAPLKGVHAVSSDNIVVVDAQTILIPNFSYDGEAPDAKFWVGRGQKPDPNGIRIPDENGRITPLQRYEKKTIVLTLPGDITIFDIGHFGVWCEAFTVDFGHVKIPSNINVPPSLKMLGVSPQSKLNCEVLYDDLAFEVRWAVAGESIVIQLVAKLDDGEYMSFGLSPDLSKTFMVGADVAVAWIDKNTGKGYAEDYFLDAKAQCAGNKGSCPDTRLGDKTNSIRVLNAATVNGYSIVTYQRPLKATDEFDLPIIGNSSQAIAWAIGPLNSRYEVSFHNLFSKNTKLIQFGREPSWNCPLSENDMKMIDNSGNNNDGDDEELYEPPPQQSGQHSQAYHPQHNNYEELEQNSNDRRGQQSLPSRAPPAPARVPSVSRNKFWEIPPIQCNEPDDGVFYAQLGPTGGKQGYSAITGHVGWGISWYINGLLIPEINVVRGKTYTFVVEGGHDPDVAAKYHPFYITDDPVGGYEYKNEEEKANVQLFAGVKRNRFGALVPTGIGRLCNWVPDPDGPPADEYSSFGAYQRSLSLKCEEGEPGVITWRPDENTPDTVYYQCFTHRYLGWKINVLDSCDIGGQSSQIDEIYVPPDQPDTLQPAQSIRHETKVNANDIYLLQNERTIEQQPPNFNGNNNLENRNDRSNYEFTKMIANGILAAEALEKSIANNKSLLNSIGGGNSPPIGSVIADASTAGQPILAHERPFPNEFHPNATRTTIGNEPIKPLPVWLTPPRTVAGRPFRYENRGEIPPNRIPQRERNHSIPYILPNLPQPQIPPINNNNRFKNIYNHGPIVKLNHERQKVTKISMPPIRRDYIANVKPIPQFPVQNQPWSLQKHIVAMRGGPAALPPSPHHFPKQKFNGPIKISKKEFAMPAKNVGFQPDSVVVESGFTPIMRRAHTNENNDHDDDDDDDNDDTGDSVVKRRHHSQSSEVDDYPEQTQRRSDRTDLTEDNTESGEDNSELLIKTFEPMFIPSPLDSTSSVSTAKTPNTKRLTGDLQYMEVEDGDDKMPMAGEMPMAYYLPPDNNGGSNGNKVKSTKLYPAGVVVTYDGRTVLDKSLLDSEPYFPTPKRSSSTEQLLHGPAFGPFHGEIPPLSPELMKPNIVRSQ